MTRPRTKASPDRARLIRDFCAEQPRTNAQIKAKFGHESVVVWAVHNLVKRGELVNLHSHLGKCTPGLYHAVDAPAVERPSVAPPSEPGGPVLRFDLGADLQRAWGGVRT